MKKTKIGVVCLARTTFDYEAAYEIYKAKMEELRRIETVEWVFIETLVITPEDAVGAGETLCRENPDGAVIISGTFHLGHLALTIDKYLRKPVLLWAFSEPPYNGGKIRLNSACGVNLDASNLYKAGNDSFHCTVGDSVDMDWLNAVRMKTALDSAHVGLAGYRADGFFNLSLEDCALFQKTGVLIDHYELKELTEQYEDDELGVSTAEIKGMFDCSCLNDGQTEKTARLSNSIERFMEKNKLDALALRCWPEFADIYGTAPCAAMSLLAGNGRTIGCEGDVEGTLSMLVCNVLADSPAFLADLSQINFEENTALMWHCGVAAPGLWDQKSRRTLDTYFAAGRGVTAGFVMMNGVVTMMRMDSARGKTRLFFARGEAIPMEKELTGTYCKVRFEKPLSEIFETITQKGVAHHVSLIYGDHIKAIQKFARIMGFEIIE